MQSLIWIGFILFVLAMLALDLGVFNRRLHAPSIREALAWTAVWIVIALLFNVGIYFLYEHHVLGIGLHIGNDTDGWTAAVQFLTGYVLEKSLSMDNIFVMAVIFGYFRVPAELQHRVLFWGVLGALVMRGGTIALGTALVQKFHWMNYVFGAMLLITAVKLLLVESKDFEPDKNWMVRLARRFYPVSSHYDGAHFFTRLPDGRSAMTPLALSLMVVEATDLVFAFDSIPAIFAVTNDPFIVFTSNVFAILGLRSLYFALAAAILKLRHLESSLVFLLAFVGVKMLMSHYYKIPDLYSLAIIAGILGVGVAASLFAKPKDEAAPTEPEI